MEDRDQLRQQLKAVGARVFSGQYLQDPRIYSSPDEQRSGAFFVDSGHGYPQLVFTRVPEANYMQHEVFGDQDVFAPPRARPLTPDEQAAFEKHQMAELREQADWFQREFIENPSSHGPLTLPPGVFTSAEIDTAQVNV